MNMKKMKKFFTLSRRAEGFTLVELIVVIAILAILGGVAVPAYSGYVKKANMQADITLASEVAHALELYYYSNPGTSGGYVIMTKEGVACAADTVGDDAMKAVFGEAWKDSVSLKYEDWAMSGSVSSAVSPYTAAIPGSSYLSNGNTPEKLLDQVSAITDTAAFLLGELTDDPYSAVKDAVFENSVNKDQDMAALCEKFGIAADENGFVNATDEQISNLLVFAVAQQVTDVDHGNAQSNDFTKLVDEYAACVAYANANARST